MYVVFVEELEAPQDPVHTARTLEQAFAQIACLGRSSLGRRIDFVLVCDVPSVPGRRHHESVGTPIRSCQRSTGT